MSNFYQEVLHIPLVIYIPDYYRSWLNRKYPKWKDNTQFASNNVDIVPTVISLLSLDNHAEIQPYIQQLDGDSLFSPALRSPRVFIAQNTHPIFRRGTEKRFAIIYSGHYKYIRDNNKQLFFDLKKDPLEKENIVGSTIFDEFYKTILKNSLRNNGLN